jgi:hypothetical protein
MYLILAKMTKHFGTMSMYKSVISTKNTNLVEDHPMNISGKLGSILFSGFREEDLNVKS